VCSGQSELHSKVLSQTNKQTNKQEQKETSKLNEKQNMMYPRNVLVGSAEDFVQG
jgi:hypothetical protein